MIAPSGIVGTPVTPFNDEDLLDVANYERLIRFLIDSGVDGLAMPMHVGESLNLSIEERKRLVEIAVGAAANKVPVFAHISMPGTGEAIDLARHAERSGAAGVVIVTPYYWQPSQAALLDHFVRIGSAVNISVTAYNYPEKLGVAITPDLICQLIDRLPNFVGIKDASLDMSYFADVCRVALERRSDFSILTGAEYLLPSMVLGGTGSFSGCGAIAPRLVRALHDACVAGRYEDARAMQLRLSAVWGAIRVGYPAGIKAAMAILGRSVGVPRPPVAPLPAQDRVPLREALERTGVLDSEPTGWEFHAAT